MVAPVLALLLCLTAPPVAPEPNPPQAARPEQADLFSYLARPDDSYQWQVMPPDGRLGVGFTNLALTSQTWRGLLWRHTITIFRPQGVRYPDTMVLYITGGAYRPSTEVFLGSLLAGSLALPVAVLWDIPNQPLFGGVDGVPPDGLQEDDLIAHTFVKAIETGEHDWPLLFPMTKAAVRAMDALQAHAAQAWGTRVERFVVLGASKRGWTTWFTGAADPRVAAIAPMVYDNLNLPAQMAHQVKLWGAHSPKIDPYTQRGLPARLDDPNVAALARLVDPYTYRDRLTMPKLIISGTNDAYWSVDAVNLFRDDLPGETLQLTLPNSGHELRDRQRLINGLLGFIRSVAAGTPRPQPRWAFSEDEAGVTLRLASPDATAPAIWVATAPEPRFTEAAWVAQPMLADGPGQWMAKVARPATGSLALFGEATFIGAGQAYTLSGPTRVVGGR